jgi:hypothetical protein
VWQLQALAEASIHWFMATNVELDPEQRLPIAYLDERYLGRQSGLDCFLFSLETPVRWQARLSHVLRDPSQFGYLYRATAVLTNVRMVLLAPARAPGEVNWGAPQPLYSLEVPLHGIWNERFQQPLFGACRLELLVNAFADQVALPRSFRLRLEFAQGRFAQFVPVFVAALSRVRQVQQNLARIAQRVQTSRTTLDDADAEEGAGGGTANALDWTVSPAAIHDPADTSQLLLLEPDLGMYRNEKHLAPPSAVSIRTYIGSGCERAIANR